MFGSKPAAMDAAKVYYLLQIANLANQWPSLHWLRDEAIELLQKTHQPKEKDNGNPKSVWTGEQPASEAQGYVRGRHES